MNSLNSVLLEGTVIADPASGTLANGTLFTSFSLLSIRLVRSQDTQVTQELRFPVKTFGRTAEGCHSMLVPGRGLRAVGRLAQETTSEGTTTWLIAETIEFKAKFDTPAPAPASVSEPALAMS